MIISATVIADSVSAAGKRITTLELTYPRYVHAEYLTHRAFSRNASSSRAVPVTKAVDLALGEMVEPIQWQKNQAGMQASSENLEGAQLAEAQAVWREAAEACAKASRRLAEIGLHKQWANRPCEWFSHIKVLCTATEWDNFFALRCHPGAQPEMQALAHAMRDAMDASTPQPAEYHLPYLRDEDEILSVRRRAMVSAARCARVSYLKHDGTAPSIGEDLALFERLAGGTPIHASPLEHQGVAMEHPRRRSRNFIGWWQFRELFEERSVA